ncbi:MAG: Surface exclusion protein Sea1 [Hymenobacter sp.]|nr:Surface exclusion protein Sea1 [Hymenobacter sp.]
MSELLDTIFFELRSQCPLGQPVRLTAQSLRYPFWEELFGLLKAPVLELTATEVRHDADPETVVLDGQGQLHGLGTGPVQLRIGRQRTGEAAAVLRYSGGQVSAGVLQLVGLLPASLPVLPMAPLDAAFPGLRVEVDTARHLAAISSQPASHALPLPGLPTLRLANTSLEFRRVALGAAIEEVVLGWSGDLTLGRTTLRVFLQVPLQAAQPASLNVQSRSPLSHGLADLAELLLGAAPQDYLPASLLGLPQLYLEELRVEARASPAQVEYVGFRLGILDAWALGSDLVQLLPGSFLAFELVRDGAKMRPGFSVEGRLAITEHLHLAVGVQATAKGKLTVRAAAALTLPDLSHLGRVPGLPPTALLALPAHFPAGVELQLRELSFVYQQKVTQAKLHLACPTEWALIPGVLQISDVELKVNARKNDPDWEVTGQLSGLVDLCGVAVALKAEKTTDDWLFSGGLQKNSRISLTALARQLGAAPADTPDIAVSKLALHNLSAKHGSFELEAALAPWAFRVGELEVKVLGLTAEVQRADGKTTFRLAGAADLFGVAQVGVSWALPGALKVAAQLREIELNAVVQALLPGTSLPVALRATLPATSLYFEKNGSDYTFALLTQLRAWGQLTLQVRKGEAGWGVLAGWALPADWRLSNLDPGLDVFDGFVLHEAVLVFSTLEMGSLALPSTADFPGYPAPTPAARPWPVLSKVPKGLTAYASLRIGGNPELERLGQLLVLGSGALTALLTIGYEPLTFALDAAVKGPFEGLGPLKGFRLEEAAVRVRLHEGGAAVGLATTFAIPLDAPAALVLGASQLRLTGEIRAGATGIDGAATLRNPLRDMFQVPGLNLNGAAVALGCGYDAVPIVGLYGQLELGQLDLLGAVYFNGGNPAQSALVAGISTISPLDVLRLLAGKDPATDISPAVKAVLEELQLSGTRELVLAAEPSPALLLELDAGTCGPALRAAATAAKLALPTGDDAVLVSRARAGEVWFITLRSTHDVYRVHRAGSRLLAELNPQLYIVPQDTDIGEVHFKEGFRVSGTLHVFGLREQLAVQFSRGKGLSVFSEMKPLELRLPGTNQVFFRLIGEKGKPDSKPYLSISTYDQPNHKLCPTAHFLLRGSLDLLGLSVATDVKLTPDGLELDLETSLTTSSIGGQLALKGSLGKAAKGLNATGRVEFHVDDLDLGLLGKITLKARVAASFTLVLTTEKLEAAFSFSFTWNGVERKWSGQLSTDGLPLRDLPALVLATIRDKVRDIFGEVFKSVAEYLEAVRTGLVHGVEDLTRTLREWFGYFADMAGCPAKRLALLHADAPFVPMAAPARFQARRASAAPPADFAAPPPANDQLVVRPLDNQMIAWLYKLRGDLETTVRGRDYLGLYYEAEQPLYYLLTHDAQVAADVQGDDTTRWLNRLVGLARGGEPLGNAEEQEELVAALLSLKQTVLKRSRAHPEGVSTDDVKKINKLFVTAQNDSSQYIGLNYEQVLAKLHSES